MTKYKQDFEKCVSKIQKTPDAYKFRREITEITSSINSRVTLWKINHSGPGCSFYEFYEWYIYSVLLPQNKFYIYHIYIYIIYFEGVKQSTVFSRTFHASNATLI